MFSEPFTKIALTVQKSAIIMCVIWFTNRFTSTNCM